MTTALYPWQAASAKPRRALRSSRQRVTSSAPPGSVRARFDSAATNYDNMRHWANADALSADAAANPAVRKILRNRSRYEVANNSFAKGIVLTLANDAIGTGPRLQMLSKDETVNREVELEFALWAKATSLAEKLRTMRMARAADGEAFGLLASNPALKHKVKLDLRLVEADQVCSPAPTMVPLKQAATEVDGIFFDEDGNPVSYRMLKAHPGSTSWHSLLDFETIDAAYVLHMFRADRPGQHRGIPELTPALPLFAYLRRYTLAVIAAAEAAADFAAILYTDQPAGGEAEEIKALTYIELERNMLMSMPEGWKLGQMDAQQPATTYSEFKRAILVEIARCLCVPYNIAAGDSAGYNYASGRLDHQTYFKSVDVDRDLIAGAVLDPLFAAWLWEFSLVLGAAGKGLSYSSVAGRILPTPHQWFWPGREHVDPAKEATAQEKRLKNQTTTLKAEFARQGLDWEEELLQLAREQKLREELGLPKLATSSPAVRASGSFEELGEELREEVEDHYNRITGRGQRATSR